MTDLRVIHTSTGAEPDPELLEHLCSGKHAAYLGDCGIDTRKLYTAYPVEFRRVTPEHGAYPAMMYRPTRRERVVGWWETYRWVLLRDAVLTVSFVVTIVAAAIILNAFVDVLAAVIEWVLP